MSTRSKNSPPKRDKDAVVIPVYWKAPDGLPSLYANQLLISHAGGEFYLFFGEETPPLALKAEDVPDHLQVVPVAKIVVAPEAMLRFAEAIQANIEKFKARPVPEQTEPAPHTSDQKGAAK